MKEQVFGDLMRCNEYFIFPITGDKISVQQRITWILLLEQTFKLEHLEFLKIDYANGCCIAQ